MPRMTTQVEPQVTPTNALIASAMTMSGSTKRAFQKEGWQTAAWGFYDTCGELRYAANWVGNVLSRATLHAAKADANGDLQPMANGAAAAALKELFNGPEGQEAMLKATGIHFFVAGECYLVGRDPSAAHDEDTSGDTIWEIVSTEEITQNGTAWQLDYRDGLGAIVLTENDTVIRLWVPHPRFHTKADSPVRAQLNNLRELEMLSRHVGAQARSRLAGNGIVWVPSEMTFPPPVDHPEWTSTQSFQATLGGAMMEAVEDPSSPESLVPIVVTAPGEYIDKARHMTFWSEYDQKVGELRTEAIRRLALGLDIPAEVMLGTADMNHWSAWQVEESSIKVNVEPMLAVISRCLTVGFIRPITGDFEDIVAFDTSKLRLRPNRSKEAVELWDRMALNDAALRRETGFDESDAPDPDQQKKMLLLKIAGGSATPEQMTEALNALGITEITATGDNMRESRPSPSLEDHPTRDMPEQQDPQAASLHDKSEVLVFRALERAGNRLRSLKQSRPPVSAADTYLYVETKVGELDQVLADAWSCLDRMLPSMPEVQRQIVASALDSYCRHLLLNQRQFDREEMVHYLTTVPLRAIS